jgi:hypothetical protein
MEIIERKDAMARGLSQYFTGRPCKNGHVTHRYTSSGACSGCVVAHTYSAAPPDVKKIFEQRDVRAERRDALASLVEVKLRALHTDSQVLKETAVQMCLARCPSLTRADVVINKAPTASENGSALYRVRIHADDVTFIRDMSNALLFKEKPDFSHIQHRLAAAQRELEETPPDWTERP